MKKILKYIVIVILSLVLIVTVLWFLPERTPQISNTSGSAVSSIEYIEIGGVEQCILIRSEDVANPIVLFLHGGPGMPMMYMAHEFQRPLEKNFTVVQWDRRGAGKTYSRNIPAVESMNVRQIVNDAYVLIDTLKKRYNREKIILVGHSFGSYLGSIMVNERPELFETYITIGQVIDSKKSKILQEEFIREKAAKAGRKDILSALDSLENPDFENWLFEFGGELKNSKSFFPLVWSGLQASEYTLPEVSSVANGSSFSSANMKYNVLNRSIFYEITEYKVPIYFMVGKNDYTTPWKLIEQYYDSVSAPKKGLVFFENSAHFPFFEEPEKFCKEIETIALNK